MSRNYLGIVVLLCSIVGISACRHSSGDMMSMLHQTSLRRQKHSGCDAKETGESRNVGENQQRCDSTEKEGAKERAVDEASDRTKSLRESRQRLFEAAAKAEEALAESRIERWSCIADARLSLARSGQSVADVRAITADEGNPSHGALRRCLREVLRLHVLEQRIGRMRSMVGEIDDLLARKELPERLAGRLLEKASQLLAASPLDEVDQVLASSAASGIPDTNQDLLAVEAAIRELTKMLGVVDVQRTEDELGDLPRLPDLSVANMDRGVINFIVRDLSRRLEAARKEAVEYLESGRPEAAMLRLRDVVSTCRSDLRCSGKLDDASLKKTYDAMGRCEDALTGALARPYLDALETAIEEASVSGNWDTVLALYEFLARLAPGDQRLHRSIDSVDEIFSYLEKTSRGKTKEFRVFAARLGRVKDSVGWQKKKDGEKSDRTELPESRAVAHDHGRPASSRPTGVTQQHRPDLRFERNSLGMLLVPIPSGGYLMGSPSSGRKREDENQVSVYVNDFYLAAHETTIGQILAWLNEVGEFDEEWINLRQASIRRRGRRFVFRRSKRAQSEDFPIVGISWVGAMAFCDWLSEKEGLEGRARYRLPTEAEWEYACRAGTRTKFLSGRDDIGKYAWHKGNSGGHPHPVGQKLPNRWGLYDMAGNVFEWTLDYYRSKLPGGIDPVVAQGEFRVFRGGSWAHLAFFCRSANREGDREERKKPYIGFRVCRGSAVSAEKARNALGSPKRDPFDSTDDNPFGDPFGSPE